MPAEQALGCKRFGVFFGRVEHHFDDALDVAVGRSESADIDPKPTRERRAHLILVEDLALDLARFHDLFGEGLKGRLFLESESQRFHPPDQAPLAVSDRGELVREMFVVPAEIRPTREFMDVAGHSPHLVRRLYGLFSALSKIISANDAEIWPDRSERHRRARASAAADDAWAVDQRRSRALIGPIEAPIYAFANGGFALPRHSL